MTSPVAFLMNDRVHNKSVCREEKVKFPCLQLRRVLQSPAAGVTDHPMSRSLRLEQPFREKGHCLL